LPAAEPKDGIVVEAEPEAVALTGDGLVEKAAQSRAIHHDRLYAKADEPASKLVHHD